jgi:methionine sulfoxide reductase heme-binding subunit
MRFAITWFNNNRHLAVLNLFALSVLIIIVMQDNATLTRDELRFVNSEDRPPAAPMFEYSGRWAIRFLLLCLLMTPLNTYLGWRWAIRLRKTAGLWAFSFAMLHMLVYIEGNILTFDWLAALTTIYLALGIVGLCILTALAITSNRWAMKHLGKTWKRLHRLVYIAGGAVALHAIIASNSTKRGGGMSEWERLELQVFLVLLVILLALRLRVVRHTVQTLKRRLSLIPAASRHTG